MSSTATAGDGARRLSPEAKVLRAFVREGRLVAIPARAKKRLVILRWLAREAFMPAAQYSEPEVNRTLARFHEDVAALRRELVDRGFMERSSGTYCLRPAESWPAD